MTQCLHDGSISGTDEFGQHSTMDDPLIQDSNGNATMPTATTDVYAQSSATFAPFVEGRFTSLLLGVDREAKLSTSAKKFHFD